MAVVHFPVTERCVPRNGCVSRDICRALDDTPVYGQRWVLPLITALCSRQHRCWFTVIAALLRVLTLVTRLGFALTSQWAIAMVLSHSSPELILFFRLHHQRDTPQQVVQELDTIHHPPAYVRPGGARKSSTVAACCMHLLWTPGLKGVGDQALRRRSRRVSLLRPRVVFQI
jgi:hypothetical protein